MDWPALVTFNDGAPLPLLFVTYKHHGAGVLRPGRRYPNINGLS